MVSGLLGPLDVALVVPAAVVVVVVVGDVVAELLVRTPKVGAGVELLVEGSVASVVVVGSAEGDSFVVVVVALALLLVEVVGARTFSNESEVPGVLAEEGGTPPLVAAAPMFRIRFFRPRNILAFLSVVLDKPRIRVCSLMS